MTQQFRSLAWKVVVAAFVTASVSATIANAGTVMYVADVEQLYAALDNPLNDGAAVILAPGTYLLSTTHAHDGRLELRRDMSLYGVAGNPAAVVIDARQLPKESFNPASGRTGVIRTGLGTNAVEWLTIHGNKWAAGSVETDLGGTLPHVIRVAHVVADGSARGADVRNLGATMAGRSIGAEIVDNEFSGPADVVGMSEGIRLSNFGGADGGIIDATLRGNRAHGFQIGCILANNRSSHASIHVRSAGDRFFGNARGCLIVGGLVMGTTGVANANSTVFEAFGSDFVNNTADIPGIDPGGIRIAGGLSVAQTNVASENRVSVSLTGSRISGNQVVDFEAFGAIQTALLGLAGANNAVTIALRGVSAQTDFVPVDSLPLDPSLPDPTGGNTVTVIRSPDAL